MGNDGGRLALDLAFVNAYVVDIFAHLSGLATLNRRGIALIWGLRALAGVGSFRRWTLVGTADFSSPGLACSGGRMALGSILEFEQFIEKLVH